MSERLFFIGPGKAGLALGYALWQTDMVDSLTYCGRDPEPPGHPLFSQGKARYVFGLDAPEPGTTVVFLSVPDEILPEIAMVLAAHGEAPAGCAAFHLSGALGTDPLAPLVEKGYAVGTFHPLQALADPVRGAERIPGSHVAVSGEPQALAAGRRLLHHLGCPMLTVPVARRPLYHAAAVFASNFVAGLMNAAARLMSQAGIPEEDALGAILPLARGSLSNLEEMGPSQGLTGPVSRGDLETVRLHLRTLEPRERALYASMGREILELARQAGLDGEVAEELEKVFERER